MKLHKRYILAGLALGLGLGFFVQEYFSSPDQSAAKELVPVVVADTDLGAGSILGPGVLRVVQWPRRILPPQTAGSVIQVTGRLVMAPITKGEPILLPKLAPLGNQRKNRVINRLVDSVLKALDYPSSMISGWVDPAGELRGFLEAGPRADTAGVGRRCSWRRSSPSFFGHGAHHNRRVSDRANRQGRHLTFDN